MGLSMMPGQLLCSAQAPRLALDEPNGDGVGTSAHADLSLARMGVATRRSMADFGALEVEGMDCARDLPTFSDSSESRRAGRRLAFRADTAAPSELGAAVPHSFEMHRALQQAAGMPKLVSMQHGYAAVTGHAAPPCHTPQTRAASCCGRPSNLATCFTSQMPSTCSSGSCTAGEHAG